MKTYQEKIRHELKKVILHLLVNFEDPDLEIEIAIEQVHRDIELELQKRGAKGIHQIQILQ